MHLTSQEIANAREQLEKTNFGDWDEQARWSLLLAYGAVESVLRDLIPIPHAITHNVALTLDEALNSIRDAILEMS